MHQRDEELWAGLAWQIGYVQNELGQLWVKDVSQKREAVSWMCVMKGCVITLRFSVEVSGVWDWRWSSKTPQSVPCQGCGFTSVSEPIACTEFAFLPAIWGHLHPFPKCPAQLSSTTGLDQVWFGPSTWTFIFFTLYPITLFLINCVTCSSHSSLPTFLPIIQSDP